MTIPPIDPSLAGLGSEWQVPGVGSTTDLAAAASGSGSFGNVLTQQIGNLSNLQNTAASASHRASAAATTKGAASSITRFNWRKLSS